MSIQDFAKALDTGNTAEALRQLREVKSPTQLRAAGDDTEGLWPQWKSQ